VERALIKELDIGTCARIGGTLQEYRRYEYKKWLDEDPNLRRWYLNTIKRSVMTADLYLRKLGNFCRVNKMTPGGMPSYPRGRWRSWRSTTLQRWSKRYLWLNGKSTQKIIPWNHLRQAITEGWELVLKLVDTNEAIVRLPSDGARPLAG
jgi:hypothetical protein